MTPPSISEFVGNLRNRVGTRAQALNDFPSIAAEILGSEQILSIFSDEQIAAYLAGRDNFGSTTLIDSFGEPGLRIGLGAGFNLDLLFWTSAQTTTHDHAFDGAFVVLDGLIAVTGCKFQKEASLFSGLEIGLLSVNRLDLCSPGHISPITAGRGGIHRSFHLTTQSKVLLLRRDASEKEISRYDYFFPGLACAATLIESSDKALGQYIKRLLADKREDLLHIALCTMIDELDLSQLVPFFLANMIPSSVLSIDDLEVRFKKKWPWAYPVITKSLQTHAEKNEYQASISNKGVAEGLLALFDYAPLTRLLNAGSVSIDGKPIVGESELITYLNVLNPSLDTRRIL